MPNDEDMKRVESKIDVLMSSLGGLTQKMDSMEKAIQSLNAKLASHGMGAMDAAISGQPASSSIKFVDLAEQLRDSVADLNDSAKKQSNEGKYAFAISELDAEIKGGIQMEGTDLHLAQLPQDRIVPESISTIRFSLRPVPVIKFAGESEE